MLSELKKMKPLEHIVNLDLSPEKRWFFLIDYKEEIDELLQCYLNDFEGAEYIYEIIENYREVIIPESYNKEIEFIATFSKFSSDQILVANLYYDILKSYFGCTAFAIDNGENLFHARNLDWHTENNLLSKHTTIFDFQRNGKTVFKSIGWMGFIGVLSGIKPKKFSITLNAILSHDQSEIAYPISFFIRDVLDNSKSFKDAKEKLETKIIASDSLLLLSGVKKNEFAVIERTPKRFETRISLDNKIVVTNDYKKLNDTNNFRTDNILSSTSCGRYDKTLELLNNRNVKNINDCFNILQDDDIQMGITVQQMVFDNRTGNIKIIKAGCNRVDGSAPKN